MTDDWVEQTIQEMIESEDEEIEEVGLELETAFAAENVRKELIVVQNDEQNGRTILESLDHEHMNIDRVHIVKLERVVE